jgi:F-type H+-transporting ATPase subunit gamma
MAKTREIRRRIKSVENTRQITKTMEMVATAKIKRAQQRIEAARPYALKMMEVLGNVAQDAEAGRNPLLAVHDELKKAVIIVLTSDRGLCGAFNSNIIRHTDMIAARERAEGHEVSLIVSGKKGIAYFNWVGLDVELEYRGISDRPTFADAKDIADHVIKGYVAGEIDRVYLVFNLFKNVAEQRVTEHLLLPVERESVKDEAAAAAHAAGEAAYIFEPDAEALLERLLPTYIEALVYRALLESAASEHGARRTAMKSASDNAQDMIGTLVRSFNRARQAQITQEISEIVGGADALKEAG